LKQIDTCEVEIKIMTLGMYLATWRYLVTWHWQCDVSH